MDYLPFHLARNGSIPLWIVRFICLAKRIFVIRSAFELRQRKKLASNRKRRKTDMCSNSCMNLHLSVTMINWCGKFGSLVNNVNWVEHIPCTTFNVISRPHPPWINGGLIQRPTFGYTSCTEYPFFILNEFSFSGSK